VALGVPVSKVVPTLTALGTSSSCVYSSPAVENLMIQLYSATRGPSTVSQLIHEYGAPTHPAGLGPNGDYFFSKDGDAASIFYRGPILGAVFVQLNPTPAAMNIEAARSLTLAYAVYAHLKA